MAKLLNNTEVHLGGQGRVVIPVSFRRELGVSKGDSLIVSLEEGRLVLEKPETVKRRLKARFAKIVKGRSLAQELILERREEAKKELKG